jgi:hypothetical protein
MNYEIDARTLNDVLSGTCSIDEVLNKYRAQLSDAVAAQRAMEQEKKNREEIKDALAVLVSHNITAGDVAAVIQKYAIQRYPNARIKEIAQMFTAESIDEIIKYACDDSALDNALDSLINDLAGAFKVPIVKPASVTVEPTICKAKKNTSKVSDNEAIQRFVDSIT